MRTWAISLAAVLALLLLLPLALCLFAFALPCQYGDTFLGELKYKAARLRETEGARIVTVGGSAVAFGQVSGLLEAELPAYSAVNFGMYAALGTEVMLDLSLPYIREGDIVILSPEQNKQTLSDYFNAEAMWQALDGAFWMLADIAPARGEALLGQFPYFAADKCRYSMTGAPQGSGAYARSAFDGYGDIAYAERPANVMPGGADSNMPVSFETDVIAEEFIDAMNEYAAACAKKGAQVYYRFCPVNEAAVEAGADIDGYYDYLNGRLDFPVLGDPHRSVLAKEWFFDTNFHLNAAGAQLNTLYLVQDIKLALGDTSPTEIEVPAMPSLPETETPQRDDSDAACFVYEAEGSGLRIVGLTAEGLRRERLTVPTHAEGLPVTALSAQTFAGNAAIRTVVLQENIRRIEDGSFAGCAQLARIELRQTSPERCSVGGGLLEGCGALVYVPADSLADYASDYFWSRYAAKLRPYEVEP